ncbi:MAG: Integral membrane sensor signal transduction histidine kinase [Parcubacteria group bacterium Gr01-1014_72]|nr:MAG: Integral membrane sensor signal transduction histidine kinase [Parcubacteria group bacterium Gr01-1014_72]
MDIKLIIHNAGYLLSALLLVGLVFLTLLGRGRKRTEHVTLALAMLSVIVFLVSHVIGVSVADPELSRQVLMWNMSTIFISAFLAHCVFALLGKLRSERRSIVGIYAVSLSLFFFYLLYPESFLLPSEPKLYFPNYYEPGTYHFLMRLLSNILVPAYFLYHMFRAYRIVPPAMRNRLQYFFTGLALGYAFGSTAIFLVYDIPVDPLWSVPFVAFFAIPFTYGVVAHELLDIKVVAKRAFFYFLALVPLSLLLVLVSFSNNLIAARYGAFPIWVMPAFASIVAVGVGIFVWRRMRETDLLKYEFVDVVTHKFRTPLTEIKWQVEGLLESDIAPERKAEVRVIQSATNRLVALTNLLVTVTETESGRYVYHFKRGSLESLVGNVVSSKREMANVRGITLSVQVPPTLPTIPFDEERLRFVIENLIRNALVYTNRGGKVAVRLFADKKRVYCEVSDTGMGIEGRIGRHISEQFFRAEEAKRADTEGMGIGLFLSRNIILRHGGKLLFTSPGAGKGSTFSFTLPIISNVERVE